MTADLTKRGESQRVADETMRRFGRVDVLINNAGSNIPERIDQITDDAWDRILELNLSATMRLTRALLPQMMERNWGRVISITSKAVTWSTRRPARCARCDSIWRAWRSPATP